MMVKEGSIWGDGSSQQRFTVIRRVEIEGNIWIHYRNEQGTEFSCYEQSFKQRFRENTNEYKSY
jgi:hypothetical protein